MTKEKKEKLKIENDLGLHGRAAAKIVELASHYDSELYFKRDNQEVDGSSILSILTLAGQKGTELQARAVGEDSEELIKSLSELFREKFGESK